MSYNNSNIAIKSTGAPLSESERIFILTLAVHSQCRFENKTYLGYN
jgi:hypothetical protein